MRLADRPRRRVASSLKSQARVLMQRHNLTPLQLGQTSVQVMQLEVPLGVDWISPSRQPKALKEATPVGRVELRMRENWWNLLGRPKPE